jgi:hypothetical protein
MAIYFFSWHLPELQHLPDEVRDDIVEEAVMNIPITRWNLFTFAAVMVPIVWIFVPLTFHVWSGFFFLYAAAFLVAFQLWCLYTARPAIRRLVEDIDRTKGKPP